jgi:hypothetical protein
MVGWLVNDELERFGRRPGIVGETEQKFQSGYPISGSESNRELPSTVSLH